MIEAINPKNGLPQPCTNTDPPFFAGETVRFNGTPATLQTVDYEGDVFACRIRYVGESFTHVAPVKNLSPL